MPQNQLDFCTPMGCWHHPIFWQTCQNILWLCKHGRKGRKCTL